MYQSGRVGDEAKKRKSPAKSGRVGITVIISWLVQFGTFPLFISLAQAKHKSLNFFIFSYFIFFNTFADMLITMYKTMSFTGHCSKLMVFDL